jgi:preprotein translocase subunit SecG
MTTILIIVHVIVCVALIMIVLLQTGKGADMGAAFGGGGSQTLFGSSGATTLLGKLTTVAAAVFMLTCLGLTYKATTRYKSSVMPDRPAASAPAPAEAPAALPPTPTGAPSQGEAPAPPASGQ